MLLSSGSWLLLRMMIIMMMILSIRNACSLSQDHMRISWTCLSDPVLGPDSEGDWMTHSLLISALQMGLHSSHGGQTVGAGWGEAVDVGCSLLGSPSMLFMGGTLCLVFCIPPPPQVLPYTEAKGTEVMVSICSSSGSCI